MTATMRKRKANARETLRLLHRAHETSAQEDERLDKERRARERRCFWTWRWGHVYRKLDNGARVCDACFKIVHPFDEITDGR